MRRLLHLLLILTLAAPLLSCQRNPATGRMQFNVLSTEQEISLGAQATPEFVKEYGGEIPDEQVLAYVRDIGHRLAAESERTDLPWEFHVLNTDVINAFALPGGKVFMTRGLMSKMRNEAQLAGVLGHEIGHVTAQHIGQRMSQALAIQGVAVGLGVAGAATDNDYLGVLGIGAQAGGTVYLLKFGRDQEHEADALGVRYMTRVGYNPIGQVQVMRILAAEAGGGSSPEFLSTHPYPENRIERLTQLIEQEYPDVDDPGRYRLGAQEFRQNVLNRLENMPAAPRERRQRQQSLMPTCCDQHAMAR